MATGKPRIFELAKELGMSSKDLLGLFGRLGLEAKNQLSVVEPKVSDLLRAQLKGAKATPKPAPAASPSPAPAAPSAPGAATSEPAPKPGPAVTPAVATAPQPAAAPAAPPAPPPAPAL